MPDNEKIYADYIQFRKDGTKYFFEDDRVPNIQNNITAIQNKDTEQDEAITAIQNKDTEQDEAITAIQNKDTEQDEAITAIQNKDTEQDEAITAIQNKDTEQDNKLTEEVKSLETKIKKTTVIDTKTETSVTINPNTYDDSQVVSVQTGISAIALPKSNYLTIGGYVEVEDGKTTPAGGSTYTCLATITDVSDNSVIFSIHVREHYSSKPSSDVKVHLIAHVIQINKEALA